MAISIASGGGQGLKGASLPGTITWTAIASITLAAGDTLIVVVHVNNFVGPPTVATWNGISMTSEFTQGDGSAGSGFGVFSLYNVAGGTGAFVVTSANAISFWSSGASATCVAAIISGASAAPKDQTAQAQGTGTGAPATANTATTTQADELLLGFHGVHGTTADTDVTTNNGDTATRLHTKVGTSGGNAATNCYLDMMWSIVSATGTYKHSWSGMTSRNWAAAIMTFKQAPLPTGISAWSGSHPDLQALTPLNISSGMTPSCYKDPDVLV